MSALQEYVRTLLVEEREALLSDVSDFIKSRRYDDVMDAAFKRIAPNLVRHVLEREINEDMSEFLDGAIEGRFERHDDFRTEDPSPAELGHDADSVDYVLGYTWGWNNADSWKGNELPSQARKEAVEAQIEEFEDKISEQMVFAALEVANDKVNPIKLLGKAKDAIYSAVQQEGWIGGLKKGLPIAIGIIVGEALDNFIIPMAFFSLTGIPVPPLPIGVGELINPIVINLVGADDSVKTLPDELGWYEKEFGPAPSLNLQPANEARLREYIREALNEAVEFREVDSPLDYHRAGNVKRLALCDTSVTDPPHESDYYFADVQEWERYGTTGRRLKKPRKGPIVPGVDDDCVIGFLDYHLMGTTDEGKPMLYIDYMKTRGEFGGQKVASRLVDEFFARYAPEPGSYVHFGKMMHPSIGHLKDKMAEKYPEHDVIGGVYYR